MEADLVIGLTGSFGSGCTKAASHLKTKKGFITLKLSDVIREQWAVENPNTEPTRPDLQNLGNRLREEKGGAYLVEQSLKSVEITPESRIAIDGIRNTQEIDYLRERFPRSFYLFGILADQDARWARISEQYTENDLLESDFIADDIRDQGEETPLGQQVVLCIDQSDVLIYNSTRTLPDYLTTVESYVSLVAGDTTRPPRRDEVFMNLAYATRLASRCLKRNVGAVVVDADGRILSTGYNENPLSTAPCVDETAYKGRCFRDIIRDEKFRSMANEGVRCPKCQESLPPIEGPPWLCPNCASVLGERVNLEKYFFPDRAMQWCTAIHAEDRALTAAGATARNGILLVTAFPCFQCTEKTIEAGITKVIFTEPYPDSAGGRRFEIAGVEVVQFEGVRSSVFERIFPTPKA